MEIIAYDVEGNTVLGRDVVERAVYPFLGPGKTAADVKGARDALEGAYKERGYQAVQVSVPAQSGADGIIRLEVVEGRVGRLRVVGAEHYLPGDIRDEAGSLREGEVLDFNKVQSDLVALNQLPGRRVTPSLRAGAVPGTVDVDLNVEDKDPLSGSFELNNKRSANTSPLRAEATVSYANLWQMGHSLTLTKELAPLNPSQEDVWSGSYLAPVPGTPLSVLVSGFSSNSDVSSVGSSNVLGKGTSVGGRVLIRLPGEEGFYHSLSAGMDWKMFRDRTSDGSGTDTITPVRYHPITVGYNATLVEDDATTQGGVSVVFNCPNWGSSSEWFDAKRAGARGQQSYVKGDLGRTQSLPWEMELFAKLEGQLTDQALITNEQFSAGGYDSVRGYLESEATGDYGLRGTLELRGPSLTDWIGAGGIVDRFRPVTFFDGAHAWILNPQAGETRSYALESVGVGVRLAALEYFQGALDFAIPLTATQYTRARGGRVLFRAWTEY